MIGGMPCAMQHTLRRLKKIRCLKNAALQGTKPDNEFLSSSSFTPPPSPPSAPQLALPPTPTSSQSTSSFWFPISPLGPSQALTPRLT